MGAQQPGLPGSQFPSEDALIRRIQDLERGMRELAAANPFAPMGMKPVPGGVEFSGNLSVPNGSITNAALNNPVYPTTAHTDARVFALAPGPNVEILRVTVQVPAGYSQALVLATATMSNTNSTAAVDEMYLDCRINGVVTGYSSQISVMAGKVGVITNVGTTLLTGLSGSFFVGAYGSTAAAAWASGAGAAALDIDAMILFLR